MAQECECGNGEFVAAVDLKLIPAHMPGNKYCRICTNCGTRHFCSKAHFERSDDKHVIPVKEKAPVEAVECDSCDGWTWVTAAHNCARCQENIFPCPECEKQVHGEPAECPHCGVAYAWDAEEQQKQEA